MSGRKVSGDTAITGANVDDSDLFTLVDVSDSTDAASGTNKSITATELTTFIAGDTNLTNAFRAFAATINEQTGTTYTLVLGDARKEIHCNNASAFTLTIPANASVAFDTGTEIAVFNKGAGQVTVDITSDTLNEPLYSQAVLVGQGSWAVLKKVASTTWQILGDLVTNTRRNVQIQIGDTSTALATGDGQAYFRIPSELNSYNLVAVAAAVTTASTSGTAINVQVHNVTDAVDMLSTALTIDNNETDSSTAATAAVIDTSHDDVATADLLRLDVDQVGSGPSAILMVDLAFN